MNNEIIRKNEGIKNTIINKKTRIINQITGLVVALILGGMMIVTYGAVSFYKTYTTSKTQKEVIQYAKDHNSEIEMEFSNGAEMTIDNAGDPSNSNMGKLKGSLSSKNVEKVIIRPR